MQLNSFLFLMLCFFFKALSTHICNWYCLKPLLVSIDEADIWSFGCAMVELLTASRPWAKQAALGTWRWKESKREALCLREVIWEAQSLALLSFAWEVSWLASWLQWRRWRQTIRWPLPTRSGSSQNVENVPPSRLGGSQDPTLFQSLYIKDIVYNNALMIINDH